MQPLRPPYDTPLWRRILGVTPGMAWYAGNDAQGGAMS